MATPQTATQFIDTLGVNVHVEYTDGKYANAANVVADLAYLGETHVRDAVLNPSNQGQSSYDVLAQAGIKFDMFFQGTPLTSTLSLVDAFVGRHPGAVALIEGPNEVNNFPISYAGLSGNAAATAYQGALNSAVKADATLKAVPVADLTSWPFLAGPSDDANYHYYPFGGEQPGTAYGLTFFSDLAALEPGKPIVMTEGGYNTALADSYYGGVDQLTQAKLTLNLYCDDAKAGVATTYIYQLLDAYADPSNTNSDDHFGLFNLDNTPKTAATAIHNLTSILSRGADAAAPATSLSFTLGNLPSLGSSLMLTKSATTHDLLIWSEPTIWDATAHAAVAVTSSNVTVHLAQAADVVIYDPLSSSQPIASYTNVQDVVAAVSDHPVIVEVTARITPAAPPVDLPPSAPVPAVNHPPVISGSVASTTSDRSAVAPFVGVVVSDADAGQAETVTVAFHSADGSLSGGGFSQISAGVYQVAAASAAAAQADLRALSFTPVSQPAGAAPTLTAFTVTVADGQATATDTRDVVTAVHTTNTPVTLGGLTAGQLTTDKATAMPFAGVVVTDPDTGQTETVTVSLSAPGSGALSGGGFAAASGQPGVYTLQAASAALAQADLRALVFTPTQNVVAPGATASTGLTVQVSDGFTSVRDATTTEAVTSVNDAPAFSGLLKTTSQTAGGALVLEPTLTLSDPDAGATITSAKVDISGFIAGDRLIVASLPTGIISDYSASSGVLTLSGAASDAAYAQALSTVGFGHDGAVGAGSRAVSFTVTDDAGATSSFTEGVTVPTFEPVSLIPSSATASGAPAVATAASATAATSPVAPVQAIAPPTVISPIATPSPTPTTDTLQPAAPVPSAPLTTATVASPSVLAGYAVETANLLRVSADDLSMVAASSSLSTLVQAAHVLTTQLDTGALSSSAAQAALMHLVDGTTSVAELSYAFFTGHTPTAAGLNYLVHSDANVTDLNDAYYARFSTQNRYINFAVNLATGSGAEAASFHTSYDGLSLSDATAKAYGAIFGSVASSDKISTILNATVSDGAGGTETRAQYFSAYGGDGPNGAGTKAAMIGWLLADSVTEQVGPYQAANTHFLESLAHGTAQYGIDLLSAYAVEPPLVGQSAPDASLGL